MKKATVLGAALGLAGCVVSACSMIAINEASRSSRSGAKPSPSETRRKRGWGSRRSSSSSVRLMWATGRWRRPCSIRARAGRRSSFCPRRRARRAAWWLATHLAVLADATFSAAVSLLGAAD